MIALEVLSVAVTRPDDREVAPDLRGQVAVVTGGGRGLGRVFARTLAAAGARVAVVARSADQLGETVALIEASGGQALAVTADVTDASAVQRMADQVEGTLGPVDLLVNGAGRGPSPGPAWAADTEEWWRCVEVNLRGPFLCTHAVLPRMIARRRGRIINVSSGTGNVATPFVSAYGTAKAALTRLTEVLAAEAREHGVVLFAIEPGTVRTAMTEQTVSSEAGRRWLPWFTAIFDEGRDVSPEDAAHLVLFLASGRADGLSGRFISRADGLRQLIERADEIRQDDLYTLRLRTLVNLSEK